MEFRESVMEPKESALVRTLRQSLLVIFFGLPVAGFAQVTILGLQALTGRQSDDMLTTGVATFVAMMTVSVYRERIFSPTRRLFYVAGVGYVVILIAVWLSLGS